MNGYFNYPSQEEIRRAVAICCGRFCRLCETPVEYAWRARDVDLSALLDLAVENELTATERKAVKLRWQGNLTNRETAKKLGVSESAVSRTLERASGKLRRALCYAVLYQRNVIRSDVVPAAVERAMAVSAAKLMREEDFAGQVRKQRLIRGYTEEQVERFAGIKHGRLARIEKGEAADAEEKARLCAFFAVMPAGEDEQADSQRRKNEQGKNGYKGNENTL